MRLRRLQCRFRRSLVGEHRLDRVIEQLAHAPGLEGRELGRRERQLVAGHRRVGEARRVILHGLGVVRRLRRGEVARADAPFRRLLRRGEVADQLHGCNPLFGCGLLEDVEVTAAGRRAAPLRGRQHAHAEIELGGVLDRSQVAGGMPHDRGLAVEEVGAQRAPFDRALGHDVVLVAEVVPVLEGLDDRGMVVIGPVAIGVHQHLPVLHRERLEHPVGVPGRRNHHAPALHLAGGVALDQLLAHLGHLRPVCRRLVGIEPGFLERVLVVVHDNGRALERNAVDLALEGAVGHQARIKALQPRLFLGTLGDVVEGDDGVLLDQLVDVDREQHRELRRLAAFQRGERLDARVVVVAGVDGIDLDARILLFESGDKLIDQLGQLSADRDRIVHVQLDRTGRPGRRGEEQAQHCGHGHQETSDGVLHGKAPHLRRRERPARPKIIRGENMRQCACTATFDAFLMTGASTAL